MSTTTTHTAPGTASAAQNALEIDQQRRDQEAAVAPGGDKVRTRSLSDYIGPVITLGIFIGLWYAMHYWLLRKIWDKPGFLITAPHRVINDSFLDASNRSALLHATWITAKVSLIGLVVAIVLGMTLAILMAQASWLERSVWPYLVALQAIPILALVPVIGSIWGFETNSRILVCVIIAIFPIVANTLFGLLSVERGQHDLFTLRGASRWTRLWKLQLPAAMPTIFAGFRIAAGLSVIGAIVGEIFFKRGEKGIGILMDTYRSRNFYPQTYGCLLLCAALGIAVFVIFGLLSRLAVGRWYETTRKTG